MRFLAFLIALAFFAGTTLAADPAKEPAKTSDKISYYKDVRPIFQQNCQGCHQPAKRGGSYNMTIYADLFKKGDTDNPGVVRNKPNESHVVEMIKPIDGKAEMPRGGKPLTEAQIRIISTWIAQGASDDTPASAFAPLVDPEHPPVYELPPVINAIAFSPNGEFLAISGYHEVLLFKGDGSQLVARFVGLSERIQSLAFSADGAFLAVSGGDPARFGEVQIWHVEKKLLKLSVPVTYDTVYGVSWSPDSSKVAFGGADNSIRAIDSTNGEQVLFQGAHADWVMSTVFSQDGQHLVSVSRDRSVKLTEVPTQRFIDNVTSITPGALKGGLLTVELRPTKDLKTEQAVRLAGVLARSPFGYDIVSLRAALAPVQPRMALIPKDAPGVPPKVYDELLVAGADGQPRLYKMHREVKRVIGDDSNKIREYEKFPGRVYSAVFNKQGNWFAAGSSLDGTGEVRVYEVDSGKRISTCEKVSGGIYAVAFHPNGKIVASAGFDGKVRFHDPLTGKLVKEFIPVPIKK